MYWSKLVQHQRACEQQNKVKASSSESSQVHMSISFHSAYYLIKYHRRNKKYGAEKNLTDTHGEPKEWMVKTGSEPMQSH